MWSLREALVSVAAAVMQVARAGTDEDRDNALEILKETRRRLYTVLAGSEGQQ